MWWRAYHTRKITALSGAMVHNTGLRTIELASNNFGIGGALALADMLKYQLCDTTIVFPRSCLPPYSDRTGVYHTIVCDLR